MKQIMLIWLFLFSLVNAQNPLMDGIIATKDVEWNDGHTRFKGFGFKLELLGTCNARYTATEMSFEYGVEKSELRKTSWNWVDIATIEVDSVKNILRFNSKNPMPCTIKDLNTKEDLLDVSNNVLKMYFKTTDMCRKAAAWSLQQIITCGGKATLIN